MMRRTVREGYQLLLRASAELWLPAETHASMREYYVQLSESCLTWAVEIEGERARARFLSLEEPAFRSRFRTENYRFWMEIPWCTAEHIAVVCSSKLGDTIRRSAQIWNLAEETLLPMRQVERLFADSLRGQSLPFRPHGMYPEAGELVLFRNPLRDGVFMERRFRFCSIKGEP